MAGARLRNAKCTAKYDVKTIVEVVFNFNIGMFMLLLLHIPANAEVSRQTRKGTNSQTIRL